MLYRQKRGKGRCIEFKNPGPFDNKFWVLFDKVSGKSWETYEDYEKEQAELNNKKQPTKRTKKEV